MGAKARLLYDAVFASALLGNVNAGAKGACFTGVASSAGSVFRRRKVPEKS
jgi:hypothetical protein